MLRYILGGTGVLTGLLFVLMTLGPIEYMDTTLQLNKNQTQTNSIGIADRAVKLRLPRDLPPGEPVLFEMTLLPAKSVIQESTTSISIEGRLDLPGVETFPASVSQVAYLPEQTISFRWLVTAGKDAPRQGRLWLTVIVFDPIGGETRTVLLAYPLELEPRRMIGLTINEARWIGGGFLGIGLVVLLLQRKTMRVHRKKPAKKIRSF